MELNAVEKQLQEAFDQLGIWTGADVAGEEWKQHQTYLSVHFKASLAFAAGDAEQVWRNIAEGLQIDGSNYELHMMLGDYYAGYNLQ